MVTLPQTTCSICVSTISASTRLLHFHHTRQNLLFVRPYEEAKMKLHVASAAAPDYTTSHRRRTTAMRRAREPL
jgi:hypothetical protein